MMSRIVPFDYSTLPADVRTDAQAAVAEYQAYERRTIEGAALVGQRLIRVRDRLEHGQFLAWLRAELPALSTATAYRWMNLTENLGGELLTVRNLPQGVIYDLAAQTTPEPTRSEIITKLKDGEQIAPKEIKEKIQTARREALEAARVAALPPEEKNKEIRKEKRRRRTEAERAAEEEQRRKENEREQKREAKATVEVMQMLSERFSDEELRRFAKLMKAAKLYWLIDLMCGESPRYCPEHLGEVFAPWKERFTPSATSAESKQHIEAHDEDQASDEPEKEFPSTYLEDYVSEREVEELIADLDDKRIYLVGQGRRADADKVEKVLFLLRRGLVTYDPLPSELSHPILDRIDKVFEEHDQRLDGKNGHGPQ